MKQGRKLVWIAILLLGSSGCLSGPTQRNPAHIAAQVGPPAANPVFIPLGPAAYGLVFEKVHDIIDDYFDIAYANRYDGQIKTFPRVAPGLEQPWKPGSPDFGQRLLATLQTIRHRAEVLIQPAPDGGFFVDIKVWKELEDLERPLRATAGGASFRSDSTIERQFEVIDQTVVDSRWIPIGRDRELEQVLLKRLECFDLRGLEAHVVPAPPPDTAGPPAQPQP